MKDKVRSGICGLGSFSFVVANTVQRSSNIERVTCFDSLAENRNLTSERYGSAQE